MSDELGAFVDLGLSTPELRCGSVLGKYKLLRELGRGGMGSVFLAEDLELGRNVALKVLRPLLGADTEFVARFKAEARSVAAVSHPNVVRINSFECIAGRHVIDMEYIDGCNLAEVFHNEVPTPARIIALVSGAVRGLAACHENGVIHRDVKPQNILITLGGRAVLSDFGIAAAFSEHMRAAMKRNSSTTCFIGTPRYAPPEAWGKESPTPAWDVYSLGLVIYEFLAGEPALLGETPFEILRELHEKKNVLDAEKLGHVSAELHALLLEMCSPDMEARPKDAGVVLWRLEHTPEWQAATANMGDTLVLNIKRRRGGNFKRALRKHWGKAAVALLLLAIILIGYAAPHLFVTGSGSTLERLASKATYPGRATAGKASGWTQYVPETLGESHNSEADLTWIMQPVDKEPGHAAIVFDDQRLWKLKLVPKGQKDFDVFGDGAEYELPGGMGFREVFVEGVGRWTAPDKAFVDANFTVPESGQSWNWTGTLEAREVAEDEESPIYTLERAGAPQALLARELLPRKRAWAMDILRYMPAVGNNRLLVPMLDRRFAEPASSMMLEEIWNNSRFTKDGRVIPVFGHPGIYLYMMEARAFQDGLYLGFYSGTKRDRSAKLRLAVSPIMSIPVADSPVYIVNLSPGMNTVGEIRRASQEKSWNCNWTLNLHEEDDWYAHEVFIPYDDFPQAATPQAGMFWRINAFLQTSDINAAVHWGHDDFHDTHHGCLLQFSAALPAENTKSAANPRLGQGGL